jgi:hypothetical protein
MIILAFWIVFLLLSSTERMHAQHVEFGGSIKVMDVVKDNTADSVIVRMDDGTLAVRDVSSLHEYQILSISADTVYLSNGGFVKLPDSSNTNEIQQMSVSHVGDTLYLSGSNWLIIPGISYANSHCFDGVQNGDELIIDCGGEICNPCAVQDLLNSGYTPMEIFDIGFPLDSLWGKMYQGGLIFYLDTQDTIPGIEGLVSLPYNLIDRIEWGCMDVSIGGTNDTIGSGQANTIAIITSCSTPPEYAAQECNELVFNGFSDWFLPSKDELDLMYHNLRVNGFGNFGNEWYWSSSEISATEAWSQLFLVGNQYDDNTKESTFFARAIRVF